MKVCTNNMICFRETTIIIILLVLIFIVIFIYQSYTMSKYKYMEKIVLNNNPLDSAVIVDNSNTCEDTLFNAYSGPFKNDSIKVRGNSCSVGVPINIKTQSVDADFRQIGLLTSNNTDSLILPLLGRPLITHRDMWQYYALSERNLKLPVINNNKNCTSNYGCNTISDGDVVMVNGYGGEFKVSLYENDTLRYIPL